ncbi:MAG: lipoate protein ligase C-terminal domain-containing protein [Candidatus Nanohaloarchaea archaeon]|nr:lipoate protein ligase C-terminal domain-containing protein [Candidatus Nanohaloarchaea archaeon]
MRGKASVKVPGGKLVRVEAEYSDVFEDVNITGDFFLEPPDALQEIEQRIEGMATDADQDDYAEAVRQVDAEMVGFSADDVAEALSEVVA